MGAIKDVNIKLCLIAVTLELSVEGLCMPIFRPLASLVWEENEVTYTHV